MMICAAFLILSCVADASTIRSLRGRESSRRSLKGAIAQPNYTLYFHKNDLLDKVRSLARANKDKGFQLESFKAENGTYHSELMVITVQLAPSSPSAPLPSSSLTTTGTPKGNTRVAAAAAAAVQGQRQYKGKLRILFDFGQHAREYITSELALHLLNALADLKGPVMSQAMSRALGEKGKARVPSAIQSIRDNVVFKILPMENILGRDLVEGGKLCERKNGRGVDPNRNWPVDWGKKEKDYNAAEEFPGQAPFSEPETQIIHRITESFKPHVWLNVHSGMEALFVPWDHLPDVPKGAQEALGLIRAIHEELFKKDHKECVVGSGGKEVGYLAHGTATDYMYEVMKVPLPFTFEIFGDLKANYDDCFKMFNPIDKAQMDETLSVWLAAILRLIDLAPSHSLVASELLIESGLRPGQGKGELIEVDDIENLTAEGVKGDPDGSLWGGAGGTGGLGSYGWMIKIGAALVVLLGIACVALRSTRPINPSLPQSSPAAGFNSKSGYERV